MVKAWHNDFNREGSNFKYEDIIGREVRTYTTGRQRHYTRAYRHTAAFADRNHYSSNDVRHDMGFPWRDPSNYSRVVMEAKVTPGSYRRVYSSGTVATFAGNYRRTDDLRPHLISSPVTTAYQINNFETVDRAITECLNKLADRKVDLSVALAESVKSVNMVADRAADLWRDLLALKRGRLPKRGGSRDLAKGYLEYNYGWKPLSMEVYGAYELAQQHLGAGREQMLSAVRNVTKLYSRSDNVPYWDNRSQDVEVLGTCKLYASLDSQILANATQAGLNNPLALGWELIPYSFVIDWGMPIGNFLEGLTATQGLNFIGGYTAIRGEGTIRGDIPLPSGTSGTPMSVEYDFLSYSRTALKSFPKPVLYAKSPFSTSNTLSALALWRNLLK